MKIEDQNPAYQREVKRITKKHKLDDSFLKELHKAISKKPTQQPDARIVRDHGSYQIVKRYVINPKKRRSKKSGFTVWYRLAGSEVYLLMIEDASEKGKELSTERHLKILEERLRTALL